MSGCFETTGLPGIRLKRSRRWGVTVRASWRQRSCTGTSECWRRPATRPPNREESYRPAASVRTYGRKWTSARPQEMTLRSTANHLTGGNDGGLAFDAGALCNVVISRVFSSVAVRRRSRAASRDWIVVSTWRRASRTRETGTERTAHLAPSR